MATSQQCWLTLSRFVDRIPDRALLPSFQIFLQKPLIHEWKKNPFQETSFHKKLFLPPKMKSTSLQRHLTNKERREIHNKQLPTAQSEKDVKKTSQEKCQSTKWSKSEPKKLSKNNQPSQTQVEKRSLETSTYIISHSSPGVTPGKKLKTRNSHELG